MSYTNKGEMDISEADDANVPVNSFLEAPDKETNKWRWHADNFMPRKYQVADGQYHIEADTKEAIVEAINKHVIPLYEAALSNLKSKGDNYYWSKE